MKTRKLFLLLFCMLFFVGIQSVVFGDWNEGEPYKWVQYPDLSPFGIDINSTDLYGTGEFHKLADDFLCTVTGPLTDFHIWCSWLDDYYGTDPHNVDFLIQIYADVPAGTGGLDWSRPGELLWEWRFPPGAFTARPYAENIEEGWMDPPDVYYNFPADFTCWQYNFYVPEGQEFIQQGSPDNPVVYWIAIQASPLGGQPGPLWGWKTRDFINDGHFNDDAVWWDAIEAMWMELRYPPGHELVGQSIDLAFVITGQEQQDDLDFGDAPDFAGGLSYPTLLANNGARHIISPNGPFFDDGSGGDFPDAEADGQPTAIADGDDTDANGDDEDGVVIPVLTTGQVATLTFNVGGPGGNVDAFIDWNADGDWADPGEQIITSVFYATGGPYNFNVAVPAAATVGQTFARFRISTAGGLSYDGLAQDGEVEDHEVIIEEEPAEKLKFQQLPLDGLIIEQFQYYGHDEFSTAYRQFDIDDPAAPIPLPYYEGCYMADDFADRETSPVTRVKWWGSYLENFYDPPSLQVDRFLIAFEKDIPAIGLPGEPDYVPSHPVGEEALLTQILVRDVDGVLKPGEFSEIPYSPGGAPCFESLFEYDAILEHPFPQDPNTVYWIKIVALVDGDPYLVAALHQLGLSACELGRHPWTQLVNLYPELEQFAPPVRWGWHNRDYSKFDPYAATPPAVFPGEHNPKSYIPTLPSIPGLADTDVWHFQDDAVTGNVFIDEANQDGMPLVYQPDWYEEYYRFIWELCGTTGYVDGPEEIQAYSKDLAFELWTNNDCFPSTKLDYFEWVSVGKPTCWCGLSQCHGDADNASEIIQKQSRVVGYNDIGILLVGFNQPYSGNPSLDGPDPDILPDTWICADFDHASEIIQKQSRRVGYNDINVLLAWFNTPGVPTDCLTASPVSP